MNRVHVHIGVPRPDQSSEMAPEEPPPEGPEALALTAYDPGEYTIDEVKEYVGEHPDQVEHILAIEQEGKDRVTLVTWLEEQGAEEVPPEEAS